MLITGLKIIVFVLVANWAKVENCLFNLIISLRKNRLLRFIVLLGAPFPLFNINKYGFMLLLLRIALDLHGFTL